MIESAPRARALREGRASEAACAPPRSENAEMLRMLAHELRSSARVLTQFSEMLRERLGASLDEDSERMLGFLHDGGTQVRCVIDGLSESEAARAPLEFVEQVDPADLLEFVLHGEPELSERLTRRLELGALHPVHASPERLARCLRHLLHNAATYVAPGAEPSVRLETTLAGDHWELRCHDTGVGIAPEHQERIWRPFARLCSWTQHPGCGLGLLTARRHAHAHGGDLRLERSTPGAGSSFLLRLPTSPVQERLTP